MNEIGLSETSMYTLNEIFKKYSCIKKVILYGSRAKGNFREGSDIDITLVCDKEKSNDVLLHISRDFEESSLPYYVDVSDFSSLKNQELVEHINRVGKIIYEKQETI